MELAVRLNQSLETLYNLEFLEYSLIVSSIKKKVEEENNKKQTESNTKNVYFDSSTPIDLKIPDHLKIR